MTSSDRSHPDHRPDDPVADSTAPPPLEPARRVGSRTWWLVATGRLAVFAVAAAAAVYAVARPVGRQIRATADHYRCPMHPDVDSNTPSTCPICGMALVQDVAVPGAAPTPNAAPAPVVRVGRQAFSEAVRAPAWVIDTAPPSGGAAAPGQGPGSDAPGLIAAMVYRDDLGGLGPDVTATLYLASAPSRGIEVALTADPPADWDAQTAYVYLRATAPPDPLPGEHGLVVIAARPHELQVVPANAVLQDADGPYVMALDPVHHRFVARPIQTGRTHHGFTAVLSGLADGDSVVATGAFLIDVDARGVGAAEGRRGVHQPDRGGAP